MDIAQHTGIDHAGAKLITLLAGVGIASWSDVAAALAALYSLLLIGEWLWKKLLRPFAERRGWLERKARRQTDRA